MDLSFGYMQVAPTSDIEISAARNKGFQVLSVLDSSACHGIFLL